MLVIIIIVLSIITISYDHNCIFQETSMALFPLPERFHVTLARKVLFFDLPDVSIPNAGIKVRTVKK